MIDLNNLTEAEQLELAQALQAAMANIQPPKPTEYRAYYDSEGKIITYTTQDIEGQYIVVTLEDYQQARHDAVVIDNKLVYTHRKAHVIKLVKTKNVEADFRASKYDISVVASASDTEVQYYQVRANEITR